MHRNSRGYIATGVCQAPPERLESVAEASGRRRSAALTGGYEARDSGVGALRWGGGEPSDAQRDKAFARDERGQSNISDPSQAVAPFHVLSLTIIPSGALFVGDVCVPGQRRLYACARVDLTS